MVKRAKLTLGQPEPEQAEAAPSKVAAEKLQAKPKPAKKAKPSTKKKRSKPQQEPKQPQAVQKKPKKQPGLGSGLVIAGLTIASLLIFRRKIF